MKPLAFLLVLTLVLFTACHTSDEPKNNSQLIEITFAYYLTDGASGYVVVTDPQGKILTNAPIENQKTVTLAPTNGYTEKTVNVYLILQANPFYHTSAYLNIQRGSVWDLSGKPLRGDVHNPVKLKLKNLPTTFDYLTLGTNYFGYTLQNSYFADTLGYGTSFNYFLSGKAYAQVVADGEGRFNTFDIDDSKDEVDIDFNMLTRKSLTKTISIPSNTFARYEIWGTPDSKTDATFFLFSTNLFSNQQFPIYYIDVPMEKYSSSLSVNSGDKWFYYGNSGDIVTQFDPLTMDATVTKSDASDFQANFTGDFDFYNAEFRDTQIGILYMSLAGKRFLTLSFRILAKYCPCLPYRFRM